jgi:ribonuclease HI
MTFYAVRRGHKTGVFEDWKSCKQQVDGVKGAVFRKFESRDEAWKFVLNDAAMLLRHEVRHEVQSAAPTPTTAITKKRLLDHVMNMTTEEEEGNSDVGVRVHHVEVCRTGGQVAIKVRGDDDKSINLQAATTNEQRDLLHGIIAAMNLFTRTMVTKHFNHRLDIRVSSVHIKNVIMRYLPKWARLQQWTTSRGEPVANRDLLEQIHSIITS